MEIRTVTDMASLMALETEWDTLAAAISPTPLPVTFNWIMAWWQAFGADARLNVQCFYDNNELVALAPMMLTQRRYRHVRVRVKQLMANGHSPYSQILLSPALNHAQVESVFSAVLTTNNADQVVLGKLPVHSSCARQAQAWLNAHHRLFGIQPSLVTPLVGIEEPWETFLAQRPKKFRRNLKHKLNRFNKAGDLSVRKIPIESSNNPHLEAMVAVSKNSWKRSIGNDLGSNPAGRQFLFDMADRLGPKGQVVLWMAFRREQPIAYEYHLLCDGVAYPVRADYDEQFKAWSPGSVVEYEALKDLFEQGGMQAYHSCADDYWYLSHWTDNMREHIHIECFANSAKGRLLYALEYRLIPKLRPVKRALQGLFSSRPAQQGRAG